MTPVSTRTAFIIVDVQVAFTDIEYWGPERSNPLFEANTASLLASYRSLVSSSAAGKHKLIHIRHSSLHADSSLHSSHQGFAYQPFARPENGEVELVKSVNSAFIGTSLESLLRSHLSGGFEGVNTKIYIAGLTTDHCVSTTTRMASNLMLADEVVFVHDATAAWKKDKNSPWSAEVVHAVNTESLKEFATVKGTKDVVEEWNALNGGEKS